MTREEQQRILTLLQATENDPAERVFAHLALAGLPPDSALRDALAIAAIPHWVDERILACAMDIAPAIAGQLLIALRRVSIIEPFPARGEGAINVHETPRLILRAWWANGTGQAAPSRFREISTRIADAFTAATSPHERVERVFHLFTADPAKASRCCIALYIEWHVAGRPDCLQALAAALAELLEPGLDNIVDPIPRAVAVSNLAAIRQRHTRQNDQPEEITRLAEAAVATALATAEPYHIAFAYGILGDRLAQQGKPDDARRAYAGQLENARRLVALDPSDPESAHHVSIAVNKIGDIDAEQLRFDDAQRAFTESLEIRQRLVALDPANTRWQRDLSGTLIRFGGIDLMQDRFEKARSPFEEALKIRRELAALDPKNTLWQRDLSIALNKLGDVERGQRKLREARRAYSEALEIRRRLVSIDPANLRWQAHLATSLGKIAGIDQAEGSQAEAVAGVREAVRILSLVVPRDPQNFRYTQNLAIYQRRLAEWEGTTESGAHPSAPSC